MLTKLSNTLLVLSSIAAVAFGGWMATVWQSYATMAGKPEEFITERVQFHLMLSLVVIGVWLVGYLISFDSKRPARPFLLICISGFFAGAASAFVFREALGAYEVLQNPMPAYDMYFVGLVAGLGLAFGAGSAFVPKAIFCWMS